MHGDAQARRGAAVIQGDHDQHFAFVGLLQGVFQQAQHGLAQARRVAAQPERDRVPIELDAQTLVARRLADDRADAVEDRREREVGVLEMQAVGLDLPFQTRSNPIPWINTWLVSDNVQVAPQEVEVSSYLVGQIDAEVDADDLSNFQL